MLFSFPINDVNKYVIHLAVYDPKWQLLLALSVEKMIAIDIANKQVIPINISSREGVAVPFTKLLIIDQKGIIWSGGKGEINLAEINLIKFTKYQPNKSARGLYEITNSKKIVQNTFTQDF
jgi:hypothetical protein